MNYEYNDTNALCSTREDNKYYGNKDRAWWGDLVSGWKGGIGYSIKKGDHVSLIERLLSAELYNVKEEFFRQRDCMQGPCGRRVPGLCEQQQENSEGGKRVRKAKSITRKVRKVTKVLVVGGRGGLFLKVL